MHTHTHIHVYVILDTIDVLYVMIRLYLYI